MPSGQYRRRPGADLASRYLKYVVKTKGGACWKWSGYKVPDGYGILSVQRRYENRRFNVYAHRLSWEIHRGPIPDKLWVLHRCDNPECTNPDHLFLGTPTDNVRDMVRKGRDNRAAKRRIGEENGVAKLTWDIVRQIRSTNECGSVLAEQFGVSKSCVSQVRTGKSWRE